MPKRAAPGRIAWVTGASRGIGRATALRLAHDGHDIAIGYHHNADAAREVQQEAERLGVRAITVPGDMGDAKEVQRAHATVQEALGTVSVFVASHGIYDRREISEMSLAAWQRTIDVNLTGVYLAASHVLPAMRAARWGRIILIGSIRGRTGSAHGAHYAAAKAGLLGLTRSIAQEVARDNVTVNLVAPGQIDTDLLAGDTPQARRAREESVPVGRLGSAGDIAAAIAYLASGDAAYVTGTELRVDGGYGMG